MKIQIIVMDDNGEVVMQATESLDSAESVARFFQHTVTGLQSTVESILSEGEKFVESAVESVKSRITLGIDPASN